MMLLTLKLLLAHSLGDFVFQPNSWVKDKIAKKHKSIFLYLHVAVHAITLAVLLLDIQKYWMAIALIAVSHFIIDLLKLNLNEKLNQRSLFALDQIAHLTVIFGVVYCYEPFHVELSSIYSFQSLALVFALINVTFVSAIIMKQIMGKWNLAEIDDNNDSLEEAGKYIGILERLFVFVFIVLGKWSAIGLLIAAKSVFRFGDLSNAKNRKLTEYVLIGTLLSFGLAMIIGLVYNGFV